MSTIRVLNADGAVAGEATFTGPVAEQEIKPHLIHETVVSELGQRRAGTHKTKNRGEVRGGGAKPWRQKGTGRARQGSIRAPHWTGGGVTFGPTPRSYGGKVNRKVRAQAFRAALRAHADRGSLAVMDPTGWEKPSSKRAAQYLYQAPEGLEARPLLVLVEDPDGTEGLSFRNIEDVYVLAAVDIDVVDLMAARSILVERAVWERLTGGELAVTEVSPTLRELPERTPPPEPKPITRHKPDDDKPKRGRKKAADEAGEPVVEADEAEAAADVETAVEEKPKRTRKKAEPATDETADDAAGTEPEAETAEPEPEAETAAEPEAEVTEKPKRARKKTADDGEDTSVAEAEKPKRSRAKAAAGEPAAEAEKPTRTRKKAEPETEEGGE